MIVEGAHRRKRLVQLAGIAALLNRPLRPAAVAFVNSLSDRVERLAATRWTGAPSPGAPSVASEILRRRRETPVQPAAGEMHGIANQVHVASPGDPP